MNDSFGEDTGDFGTIEEHIDDEESIDLKSIIYDEDSSLRVYDVLLTLGFDFMFEKFKESWIDFEALVNLETQHILALFGDFPLGVSVKFQAKLKEWKATQENSKSSQAGNSDKSKIEKGTVAYIFNETSEGQRAVEKIHLDRKLGKKNEQIICRVIASYFIANKIELSITDIGILADDIQNAFPLENPTTFFNKITKKGPLYDKYHNSLRLFRSGSSSALSSKKAKLSNYNQDEKNDQYYNEEEVYSHDFVKSAFNNVDMTIIIDHWKRSSKLRVDYLRKNKNISLSAIYPAIKRPDGYILVNCDFDSLYTQRNFQNEWNKYQADLLDILKRDVTHEVVKNRLDIVQSLKFNQQVAVILLGLSCHLHGLKFSLGDTKKNPYKPTTYDTFNSILLIASQESDLELDLNNYHKQLFDKNMTQQVIIIGFGKVIENLEDKFCVVFEDTKYMLQGPDSLLRAIELAIKVYHVLDLEYPLLSKSVYSFLSAKFLHIDQQKESSKVTRLLNSFVN